MTVVVGGVSQLYQGDLDLGRHAVERLRGEALGEGVAVEDLHYGAVAVAQRLEELDPDHLVLVGAETRGRPPGAVERRRLDPPTIDPAEVQGAVADAATGYVGIDLVVAVAAGFGVLPPRVVAVEVEPVDTGPSERLSAPAEEALEEVLRLIRAEIRRAPLFEVAAEVAEALAAKQLEPCPAVEAVEELLGELRGLDRDGRWGRAFSVRDLLRLRISMGETGEGMDGLDWVLWWHLIEELDRLQRLEVDDL